MVENVSEFPKGIKWTKQRKDIYRILLDAERPMSALEIYHKSFEGNDSASYALSTIYRVLSAFEEQKLVTKSVYMDEKTVVYELDKGGHTHYAVCLNCHKRIALQSCPFTHIHMHGRQDGIIGENAMEENFLVTGHKLELYGYCNNCRGE